MNPSRYYFLTQAIQIMSGALMASSVLFSGAMAHEWFTGTKDPVTGWGCCNNLDCKEIEDSDVRQVEGGYIYLPTGEFIPRARIQSSKTWRFARCEQMWDGEFQGTKMPKGSTRCFFEPGGF